MNTKPQTDGYTELLINLVSVATQTSRGALLMRRRGEASVAHARQIAMYLSHTGYGNSLTKVGAQFGRDKSTVGHAVHIVEDLREDAGFELWISELEAALDAGKRCLDLRYPGRALNSRKAAKEEVLSVL